MIKSGGGEGCRDIDGGDNYNDGSRGGEGGGGDDNGCNGGGDDNENENKSLKETHFLNFKNLKTKSLKTLKSGKKILNQNSRFKNIVFGVQKNNIVFGQ